MIIIIVNLSLSLSLWSFKITYQWLHTCRKDRLKRTEPNFHVLYSEVLAVSFRTVQPPFCTRTIQFTNILLTIKSLSTNISKVQKYTTLRCIIATSKFLPKSESGKSQIKADGIFVTYYKINYRFYRKIKSTMKMCTEMAKKFSAHGNVIDFKWRLHTTWSSWPAWSRDVSPGSCSLGSSPGPIIVTQRCARLSNRDQWNELSSFAFSVPVSRLVTFLIEKLKKFIIHIKK